MLLEVHERLVLTTLLPKKGDYAALKTLRRAQEMIAFTPDEITFYEIRNGINPETGKSQVQWNQQRASEQVKDIPIDEYITNLVRNKLAEMDRKGELTSEFMSVYEKFVIIYQ